MKQKEKLTILIHDAHPPPLESESVGLEGVSPSVDVRDEAKLLENLSPGLRVLGEEDRAGGLVN